MTLRPASALQNLRHSGARVPQRLVTFSQNLTRLGDFWKGETQRSNDTEPGVDLTLLSKAAVIKFRQVKTHSNVVSHKMHRTYLYTPGLHLSLKPATLERKTTSTLRGQVPNTCLLIVKERS